MYGPWEIVDWEVGTTIYTERRYIEVRFKRLRDGNKQTVYFSLHDDGRWRFWRINKRDPHVLTYPRELKVAIRSAYKLLNLINSVEKDNEQNQ